ncbi:MAG: Adaptive-response sensory-kinase SasA [Bacteroidia bacterium]|nr:Adaptive-response sensory-kinase SasA [Bacteroidia bacterium]
MAALLLLAASHVFNTSDWFHPSLEKQANHFQKKLLEKETLLENTLAELVNQTQHSNEYNSFTGLKFGELFHEEGMLFLIYEEGKLKFWSDNSVPAIDELTSRRNYEEPLQKLSNGWYLSKNQKAGNKTYIGLLLIKNEYPFENNYLQNGFNKCLGVEDELEISPEQTPEALEIKTKEGVYLLSVTKGKEAPHVDTHQIISIVLFIAGLCFLLAFFYGVFNFSSALKLILFSLTVLLLRAVLLYFQYPAALYALPLFDPAYHASSAVFPSLGDFLLNIVTIAGLTFYLTNKITVGKSVKGIVISTALLTITLCLHFPVAYLFEHLIVDSDIDFTINNLFTLNFFSYAGLFITGLILLTWFLIFNKTVEHISANSLRQKLISYSIAVVAFAGIALLTGAANWQALGITAMICGAIIFISEREKSSRSVFSAATLLLGFSVYAAYSLANFHKEKVEIKARFFAEKLAAERDPVAEYVFSEVASEIQNDRIIKNFITLLPQKQGEFFSRMEQKFLNDYLQKYDVRISVFNTNDTLIASNNKRIQTAGYYKSLESSSKPTSGKSLVYSYETTNEINYLGKIIFTNNSRDSIQKQTTVYIEFEEKNSKNELGFPELLLDKNVDNEKSLEDYSFAVYRDGKIVSANGNFSYSADEPAVQLHNEKFEFRSSGNWRHLFYKPNPDTLILLSRPQLTTFQKLTGVSFLFLFYSVLLLVTMAGYSLVNSQKIETENFRNRINISVISILTIFLLLIGFATIYYVETEYSHKNNEAISEKIRSVLIELENKSAKSENFYGNTEQLGYTLNKFSKVFFTDINLYDTKGELIVSTRPRLFDIGLISGKLNSDACFSMLVQKKTLFVHNENIGALSFLSAYAPLTNSSGETVAYLNLPYFAKQSDLQKEILTLLSALINIYVLLIIIAVAVAIFISRKITEPFDVIGKNIQQVKLGKENKPIEWNSDDEIGRLVKEYNNMIQKLGESAETLAKSERESAWREMAKQVAHEIKNPLTPMKLSVQHLQHSYKEQRPGWDKNIERMTQTMIEQIDTLAHIASEFSNFAKMPKANNEKINIADAIANVVALYNETENCKIEFNAAENNLFVLADREQLQRVYNNLIKNAIQSVPETREGKILITLEKQDNTVLIKIQDNGSGISDEMKDKIFTPNFTTKSTGMGLGLAMVKSIIENSGGSVHFETTVDEGTVFYVSLPLIAS